MDKLDKSSNRLLVLDGLRGLMCLLVVWQHMGLSNLKDSSQSIFTKWFFWVLANQGGLGVFFFFALAGFLMTYLYPKVDDWKNFYLKRLGRILPLYWSIGFVFTLKELFHPKLEILIPTLIFTLFVSNWISVKFFTSKFSAKVKLSILMLPFALAVITYSYYLRQPVSVLRTLDSPIYFSIVYLVNATLTFWLGDYIPIVGLVFWSMGLEVLFYLFYPVINKLFLQHLYDKSLKKIFQFVFISVLWYSFLLLIEDKIFQLKFFHPETSIYFIVGIFWGLVHPSKNILKIYSSKYHKYMVVYLALVLFMNAYTAVYGHWFFTDLTKSLIEVPLVFYFFGYILSKKSLRLNNFFESKVMVFLATISYSLYLIHSFVIDMFGAIQANDTFWTIFFKYIFLTIGSIIIAALIYQVVEKQYFTRIRQFLISPHKKTIEKENFSKNILYVFVFILILIIVAHRPKYGLLSFETNQKANSNFTNEISLSTLSTPLSFTSSENNLGIIYFPIKYEGSPEDFEKIKKDPDPLKLKITLQEQLSGKTISTQYIEAWKLSKTMSPYAHGIPMISNSKNVAYKLNLSITKSSSTEKIFISPLTSIRLIHTTNKSEILKNPLSILILVTSKIKNILFNVHFLISITFYLALVFYTQKFRKSIK